MPTRVLGILWICKYYCPGKCYSLFFCLDAKEPKDQGCRKMAKIHVIPLQRISLKLSATNALEQLHWLTLGIGPAAFAA
jgi:hypothetical protein